MTDFLWTIGPFLLPLIALSVYSVGLILSKNQELGAARAVSSGDFVKLLEAPRPDNPVVQALPEGHPLRRLASGAEESPRRLQATAQTHLARLEDRLSYFPALATLTGLFGTVCGMIAAFLALRSGGGADPASLAGGLGQALAATAAGLVTAIPSLAAHAVFQKQVQSLASQMEALLTVVLPEDRGD